MQHALLSLASAGVLATAAFAQSSTACLPIGTNGAVGCQSASAPVLTGGVIATGIIDFDYNQTTAILEVRVTNTSPVLTNANNPVITGVAFSFPFNTVNNATLVSQTALAGATPNFGMQFTSGQFLLQGCMGCFSVVLTANGPGGGIGNDLATQFANPPVVLGRTTFRFQLSGPGVGTLDADAISSMLSGGGTYNVASSFFFEGGGASGSENGYVSSGFPCCPNNAMFQSAGTGCAPSFLSAPTVTGVGLPYVGDDVVVDVSSPATPNAPGLLIHGFSNTFDPFFGVQLPLDLSIYGFPGCSLYPSNEFVLPILTDATGSAGYSVSIPGFGKWCGRTITYQAFFVAPNGGAILSSDGLTATLGS